MEELMGPAAELLGQPGNAGIIIEHVAVLCTW